jgi:two-component system NtrC family sensor kinase
MGENPGRTALPESLPGAPPEPMERQVLAFDALSKLTRRFCDRPDFEQLMDVLLMTLCGQFSIGDSFALLKKPSARSLNKSFFATGRFREDVLIPALQIGAERWMRTPAGRRVQTIEEFDLVDEAADQIAVLARVGVKLICPLVHSHKFFGIIGLGSRVTGAAYAEEDMELLDTIISTVTPLVANSYLFWDLASLNAWYLDILDSVRQGVFVFDKGFRLRKVNSAGMDLLKGFRDGGVELEDVEGKPIDQVFPQREFESLARKFVDAGRVRPVVRSNLIARTGAEERVYNVSVSGSVENDEIGAALVITLDDVTLQKQNEERLFELQQLADKGVLASSISHELNNFLGLILGGVELTEFALKAGNPQKAAANLAKLKGSVANLERFTKGLVDLATPANAKRSGDLNSVIEDVLAFLSVQKRFKGIRIESHLGEDLPQFLFDPDQITQLLLNLLNNAADAIHEAGTPEGRIAIETRRPGDQVLLEVGDNGGGISPDLKDRLFKYRLSTKTSGHGYGLVTCANIVRDHHGSIEVSSEIDAGSTFTVRLPVVAKAESE